MYRAISLIPNFWLDILNLFAQEKYQLVFSIYGVEYRVSYFILLAAFLIVAFVVSIYWRGAKS